MSAPTNAEHHAALEVALTAAHFPYDRDPFDNVRELRAILHAAQGIQRRGTASLDLVAVACGWLEGYWELGLKPWDMSAGALLVAEAGERVTTLAGAPFRAEVPDIVATNGAIHDALLTHLAAARTSDTAPLSIG